MWWVIVAACVGASEEPAPPPGEPAVVAKPRPEPAEAPFPVVDPTLVVERRDYSRPHPYALDIAVTIPRFRASDAAVSRRLDEVHRRMEQYVQRTLDHYERNYFDDEAEAEEARASDRKFGNLLVVCVPTLATPEVISVYCDRLEMPYTAANPLNSIDTLNFLLTPSVREVQWPELVRSERIAGVLQEKTTQRLLEQRSIDLEVYPGDLVPIEKMGIVGFEPEGMTFHFEQYALAGRPAGDFSARVPWLEVEQLIPEDLAALRRFAKARMLDQARRCPELPRGTVESSCLQDLPDWAYPEDPSAQD